MRNLKSPDSETKLIHRRLRDKKSFEKGYTKAKKEILKLINNIKNPYPLDVFPRLESEDVTFVVEKIKDNSAISPDRYAAHLMRIARENLKDDLIEALTQSKGEAN
jgi:hypothetical protein